MANQYNSVIYFLCFIKGCTLKAVSNYGNWARVALNSPVTWNPGTTTLTANRLVCSWNSSVTSDLLPAPSDSLESILYLFYWINSILPAWHSTHTVLMEQDGYRPVRLRMYPLWVWLWGSPASATEWNINVINKQMVHPRLRGKGHFQVHLQFHRS